MKTFQWTIPELKPSSAERRSRAAYLNRSLESLSKSEQQFLLKWGEQRKLGRRAFRRKTLLRSCLALALVTGGFLLLKILGFVERETTLFTSAVMFSLIANIASGLPSWKKREKRYKTLLEKSEQ